MNRTFLLAAMLFAVVFAAMGFLANNRVDQWLLFGAPIWIVPMLCVLLLRKSAYGGFRYLCYMLGVLPLLLVVSMLTAREVDVSVDHLSILAAGVVTLVSVIMILFVVVFERSNG